MKPSSFAILVGAVDKPEVLEIALELEKAFAHRDTPKKTMARLCMRLKRALQCTDLELAERISAARKATGGKAIDRSWVTRNVCAGEFLERRPEFEDLGIERICQLARIKDQWIGKLSPDGKLGRVNVFACSLEELKREVDEYAGGPRESRSRRRNDAWDLILRTNRELLQRLPDTAAYNAVAREFRSFLDRMDATLRDPSAEVEIPETRERRKAA